MNKNHVKFYVKKPIQIEAMQFVYTKDRIDELKTFCGDFLGTISKARHIGALAECEIKTLEDGDHMQVTHIATEGDYIIKGIRGEFYPCKPDIFRETYQEVCNEEG